MDPGFSWCDRVAAEPIGDGDRIEAQKVSPLHLGDASLGDQSTNVSHGHVEVRRDRGDVDEARDVRAVRRWSLDTSRAAFPRSPPSRSSCHGHDPQLLDPCSLLSNRNRVGLRVRNACEFLRSGLMPGRRGQRGQVVSVGRRSGRGRMKVVTWRQRPCSKALSAATSTMTSGSTRTMSTSLRPQ